MESLSDIVASMRRGTKLPGYWRSCDLNKILAYHADRIEAAATREIDEIVSAVSELREGMCLHCDLQDQCADGEDGMPTTCNVMAKVNNFINRYKKVEARDECPF